MKPIEAKETPKMRKERVCNSPSLHTRVVESKKRVQKLEAQELASHNYILADLIGRSVARIYSSSAKMPHISEAYPSLFSNEQVEEQLQEKRDELSILRFKQFTQSFNERFKEVGKQK